MQGVKFAAPEAGCRPLAEPAADGDAEFQVLTIATDGPDDHAEQIREWMSAQGNYQLVSLHGAHVHWSPSRLAVVASPEFVEPVRRSLLEAAHLENELRAVEAGVAEAWEQAEADAPLAFEFRERDAPRKEQLARRFVLVTLLRCRLAKITPRLLTPQAYPPTLAGQTQERLRERLGVAHRVEAAETQLEAMERIYDGCAQRASEYLLTRKSLTLEWVIVVLLAMQTLLTLYEIVAAKG